MSNGLELAIALHQWLLMRTLILVLIYATALAATSAIATGPPIRPSVHMAAATNAADGE